MYGPVCTVVQGLLLRSHCFRRKPNIASRAYLTANGFRAFVFFLKVCWTGRGMYAYKITTKNPLSSRAVRAAGVLCGGGGGGGGGVLSLFVAVYPQLRSGCTRLQLAKSDQHALLSASQKSVSRSTLDLTATTLMSLRACAPRRKLQQKLPSREPAYRCDHPTCTVTLGDQSAVL